MTKCQTLECSDNFFLPIGKNACLWNFHQLDKQMHLYPSVWPADSFPTLEYSQAKLVSTLEMGS